MTTLCEEHNNIFKNRTQKIEILEDMQIKTKQQNHIQVFDSSSSMWRVASGRRRSKLSTISYIL